MSEKKKGYLKALISIIVGAIAIFISHQYEKLFYPGIIIIMIGIFTFFSYCFNIYVILRDYKVNLRNRFNEFNPLSSYEIEQYRDIPQSEIITFLTKIELLIKDKKVREVLSEFLEFSKKKDLINKRMEVLKLLDRFETIRSYSFGNIISEEDYVKQKEGILSELFELYQEIAVRNKIN